MPIVSWDSSLVLDIQCFDNDHKHLVHLINTIYDMMLARKNDKELGEVLDELIAYTVYHFSAEETWMQSHKYPKFTDHKQQHDLFSKEIMRFHQDFINGEQSVTESIFSFLKQWLIDHIQRLDSDYAQFARTNGIRE